MSRAKKTPDKPKPRSNAELRDHICRQILDKLDTIVWTLDPDDVLALVKAYSILDNYP